MSAEVDSGQHEAALMEIEDLTTPDSSPSSSPQDVLGSCSQFPGDLDPWVIPESGPKAYVVGYARLRHFIELMKGVQDLSAVLWPIFVHSYLDLIREGHVEEAQTFIRLYRSDHERTFTTEVLQLSWIHSPNQLALGSIPLLNSFLKFRPQIRMSPASHQMLMSFLGASGLTDLSTMVRDRMVIDLLPQASFNKASADKINRTFQLRAGVLPEIRKIQVEGHRLREAARSKPRGRKSPSAAAGDPLDNVRWEISRAAFSPPREGSGHPASVSQEEKEARLADLAGLANVSSAALPSVVAYTVFDTGSSRITCLTLGPAGDLVAGGFTDSSIWIWRVAESVLRSESPAADSLAAAPSQLLGHSAHTYSLSFSPDCKHLLSCSHDSTVRLWEVKTGRCLVVYRGHVFPVWDVSFSPLGFYFATASHDQTARVWSTDRLYPLRIMAGHRGSVECVRFHPNSTYIATGSSDCSIRLWDIPSRGETRRLLTGGHQHSVECLTFSDDGNLLASGDSSGQICLWDLNSGRLLRYYDHHTKRVTDLGFSREASLLASCSEDRSVAVWRVETVPPAQLDAVPRRGPQNVHRTSHTVFVSLSFTPRNLLIASGIFRP